MFIRRLSLNSGFINEYSSASEVCLCETFMHKNKYKQYADLDEKDVLRWDKSIRFLTIRILCVDFI